MRIERKHPWSESIVWWRTGNGESGYPITDYLWMVSMLGIALGAWALMAVLT